MKLLVPGVLLGVSLLCGGCGPSAREKAAVLELQKFKDRVRAMGEESEKREEAAREALQAAREEAEKKEKDAATEREAVKKQLDEVKKAFDDYKTKYRVSARAPGQKFVKLDCGDGKIFANVEIVEVTPGEMRFSHAYGSGKVALGMLEAGLRDRMDYDPEEAAAWLASNTPKISAKDDEPEKTPQLSAKELALAKVKARKMANEAAAVARMKQSYVSDLNTIYASARALQANQNCCPVHKRYQLAAYEKEAARLKRKIASL